MSWMITVLRRSLWLVLIGALGGVAWSWWSDRNGPPNPPAPPEWPPLRPMSDSDVLRPASGVSDSTTSTADTGAATTKVSTVTDLNVVGAPTDVQAHDVRTGTAAADLDAAAAPVVNALADAPNDPPNDASDARSSSDGGDWVEPDADGNCPPSHPVKANNNSGIFHVPGGRFYARTRAERCYRTADAAAADGYRAAKA